MAGRSAIKELAYKIVAIENLTDYETGVTVNVGIVSGGEARNTVAPCAEGLIDLRYPHPNRGWRQLRVRSHFSEVCYSGNTDDITTDSWVNLHAHRIPTEESTICWKNQALGRLLGQELGVTDSGGGTDGSLTQAAGCLRWTR